MMAWCSLGIDLASQPKATAICRIEWQERQATVQQLDLKMHDHHLLPLMTAADCVGIDVPFGWPQAFTQSIAAAARFAWPHAPGWSRDLQHSLQFRRTELHLKDLVPGLLPLSVSSDKLGVPAMRAAGLLNAAGVTDRSGQAGNIYEVYPAASLRQWGIDASDTRKSKDPGRDARKRVLAAIRAQAAWLNIDPAHERKLLSSHHLLDALIASLSAQAAARRLVDPVPEDMLAEARVEGWIMLPDRDALQRLLPR